jgi:hypothetical protein
MAEDDPLALLAEDQHRSLDSNVLEDAQHYSEPVTPDGAGQEDPQFRADKEKATPLLAEPTVERADALPREHVIAANPSQHKAAQAVAADDEMILADHVEVHVAVGLKLEAGTACDQRAGSMNPRTLRRSESAQTACTSSPTRRSNRLNAGPSHAKQHWSEQAAEGLSPKEERHDQVKPKEDVTAIPFSSDDVSEAADDKSCADATLDASTLQAEVVTDGYVSQQKMMDSAAEWRVPSRDAAQRYPAHDTGAADRLDGTPPEEDAKPGSHSSMQKWREQAATQPRSANGRFLPRQPKPKNPSSVRSPQSLPASMGSTASGVAAEGAALPMVNSEETHGTRLAAFGSASQMVREGAGAERPLPDASRATEPCAVEIDAGTERLDSAAVVGCGRAGSADDDAGLVNGSVPEQGLGSRGEKLTVHEGSPMQQLGMLQRSSKSSAARQHPGGQEAAGASPGVKGVVAYENAVHPRPAAADAVADILLRQVPAPSLCIASWWYPFRTSALSSWHALCFS